LIDSLVEADVRRNHLYRRIRCADFLQLHHHCQAARDLVQLINATQLSPTGVILLICLIYLVLGCLLDSLAMILLTVPVFFPIIKSLGLDPVWFGIIVIIVVEIGLITPPIGLNVFVVQSMVDNVTLGQIFQGIAPFFFASVVGLLLIIYFPIIALWLPNLMH
jgi:TRAP-type C4-dicarboxylate transport system permease large subunit